MTTTRRRTGAPAKNAAPWTFLTNHTHVLLCIVSDPDVRVRDVAAAVGVTERAVQRIISELEEAGYLLRTREGRRNRYEVRARLPLRHQIEQHCHVADLLAVLSQAPPSRSPAVKSSGGRRAPRPA